VSEWHPQDVDVAKVMDAIKITALHQVSSLLYRGVLALFETNSRYVEVFSGFSVFHFVEQGTLAY
jgi:hypothetical protein